LAGFQVTLIGRFWVTAEEYDGYLGGVYELLVGGASDKEIADHLGRIVEERMSLHPQGEATERTVRALRAIQIPQQ
jgi:hypothetical protein